MKGLNSEIPFWVCTKHQILIWFQMKKKKKSFWKNINNNNNEFFLKKIAHIYKCLYG